MVAILTGGEGNGTPLQYSCLENPMDGGACWAAVHGVARSRTRLSDFTSTFHLHALEKEIATRSSVLAWRILGMGEPGGLPSLGSHRVGHDWSDLAAAASAAVNTIIYFLSFFFFFFDVQIVLSFDNGSPSGYDSFWYNFCMRVQSRLTLYNLYLDWKLGISPGSLVPFSGKWV